MPLSDYLLPYRPGRAFVVDQVSTSLWYVGYATTAQRPSDSAPVYLIQRLSVVGLEVRSEYANDGTYSCTWQDRESYFGAVPQTNAYSTDFDGVNDYITITDTDFNTQLGTSYSFSTWVKFSSVSVQQTLASVGRSSSAVPIKMLFRLLSTGKLELTIRDDASALHTVADTRTLSVGQWYHVAAVRNGNTSTLYVDGTALVSSAAALSTITCDRFSLGARVYTTTDSYLAGRMDDVCFWSRALTTGDIAELYGAGTRVDPLSVSAALAGDCVCAYYMGDGASFPNIPDESGLGNTGVMSNMTSSDFVSDVP